MFAQDPPPARPGRRRAAHILALAALVLAVAGAVLAVANRHGFLTPSGGSASAAGWTQVLLAVPFVAAGWLLATRRPEVPFGWLALAAAIGHGVAAAGTGWAVFTVFGDRELPGAAPALLAASTCEALGPLVLAIIWATFPQGRFPHGWVGRLAAVSVGLCAVGWLSGPLWSFRSAESPPAYAGLTNPIGVDAIPGWLPVALFSSGLLLGSAVMVVRWMRADGELRQVLRWLAVINAVAIVLTPVVVALPAGELIGSVGTVVELVVVVAVVLANRVYGIEAVLNRTLVYTLLTAFVAVVYAAGVAVLVAFGQQVGGTSTVLAAVGAAFSLAPARDRVQRMVNRFLYGERDEPYTVVTGVAARLEAAGSVQTLLPGLLEALVGALRLPSAAVEMRGDDGSVRSITHGEAARPGASVRFPLVHQGQDIGALVVSLRAGQNALAPRENRLLTDIARQVAVAASNVQLTEALMRSRERIVSAAEEERRRLRHDLHDGLGPTLTAAATKVDAAGNLVDRDVARTRNLLDSVRRDLTSALADLRRLVYALRPPVLDELGLLPALREQLRHAAVPVVVSAPESLPPLPAAVEIAAYRIITEAITNVTRHARASSCEVSITCVDHLRVEIRDNGTAGDGATGDSATGDTATGGTASGSGSGSGATWAPGVGLTSMRERATALGGSWIAGPTATGGRVLVELPLSLAGSAIPRSAAVVAPERHHGSSSSAHTDVTGMLTRSQQ
ncbi:sensor histidine kinase [Parafrankia sp. BMG5.11]|uniref:sensor histidine kinase n=1 Tax=Parafrankia sp. BMG5.11 TaxID=222540 RepID=UPI00103FAEEB|nr:sensor histidine kinase [Parafrankia sp. BMG5.11]TCJ33298.1 sensor histidine kinase [Parafrankia sp. BMG5.11]